MEKNDNDEREKLIKFYSDSVKSYLDLEEKIRSSLLENTDYHVNWIDAHTISLTKAE